MKVHIFEMYKRIFNIFICILHNQRVYYELTMHRHRRGHGFKHREGLSFFQALILMLLKIIIYAFIAEFGFSPGTAVFSRVQKPVFPNTRSTWMVDPLGLM